MNIQHSSRSDNWGTPSEIISLVHQVIPEIDLDPASSEFHNQVVKAKRFITKEEDGLLTDWGNEPIKMFINPPGGKLGNKSITKLFWEKLADYHWNGLIDEAIFMCFSVESLQNSQSSPLSMTQFPICIPSKRIKFVDGSGLNRVQPSHSNAIIYLGRNEQRFADVFSQLGSILRPF